MFNKSTLKNGIRVVTQKLESTKSITVLILVGAGSRYETREINGISHFLEHMFFKGAEKYRNAREVSETIDAIGGDFNAFTGKEYVGYYVKAAAEHADTVVDVLSDMLLKAKFDPVEIDKERGVIMEEYHMYLDTPMHQIGWDFERLMYGDQPMGWDQVGTEEVIMRVKQADFQKYKNELYVPSNVVIAVAGALDHEEVVKKMEQYFGPMAAEKKAYEHQPLQPYVNPKRLYIRTKKTEQSHICVGFPMVAEPTKDYWTAKVASIILGGGMSSRMFMSVREEKGLAYYTTASAEGFTDSGIFSTNAGVTVEKIDLALDAVLQEYWKMAKELVPAAELRKAKEYIKGKTILRLEDSEEYAHLLGKYEVLYGKVMTPDEVLKAVDAVTAEDVLKFSQETFKRENMHIAIIGPYDDEQRFLKLM